MIAMTTTGSRNCGTRPGSTASKTKNPSPSPATSTTNPTATTELWQAYKANPSDALRNQLLERYLPIVRYSAERLWAQLPDGVELDDLVSAGVFGLIDAIAAFELERGVKFETYCVLRIRGAMLDELRAMDWVPRLVRAKASKLKQALQSLEERLGRQPTEAELAAHLQLSVPALERMLLEANTPGIISLSKKWFETDSPRDVHQIDLLSDRCAPRPSARLEAADVLRLLTKGLNRNERLVVILYYYEELTMKEIGHTLGLSESRVSQMHSVIVARLRQQLDPCSPELQK